MIKFQGLTDCPNCESNQIEDESHVVIYYIKYSILKDDFYKKNRKYRSKFEAIREVKHDVNGRRQTPGTKTTSDFQFFSSNP